MFFDLSKSLDKTLSTRPIDFYIQNGRPTLELDHPLVIFCDEETKPLLEPIRGNRPTTYIVKSIFDYDYVKSLLPIIIKNRETHPSCDIRNTPSYFLLTFFKCISLHLAKQQIHADTYMWLDFGISHIVRDFPNGLWPILNNPRPKIGLCYVHYRSKQELYPMKKYLAHGGYCAIAAGMFTVESNFVDKLYMEMMSILYEQVGQGIGHSDEQVMIYVYDRHPEWFSLFFGDYYSLITNYHHGKEDKQSIQTFFIQNAMQDNRNDLAEQAKNYMV